MANEIRVNIIPTVTFFYLAQAITLTFLLLPILNVMVPLWWLDNLINLQLQWSLIAFILILLNICYFKKQRSLFTAVILLSIFYNLFPLFVTSNTHEASTLNVNQTSPRLAIAQLNLNYNNPNLKALLPTLKNALFDILVLQEASDTEYANISAIAQHYPYSFGISGNEATPSGLVIFSRLHISDKRLHTLEDGAGHVLEIITQTSTSSVPIQLFAIHPSSPRNKALWVLRNKAYLEIATLISESPFPHKIVIGDFNGSPWNYSFRELLKSSQLRNSAEGFGYIPSWSYRKAPFLSLVTSAYIDHTLVSDAFTILSKQHRVINGSDHLLLFTEFSIRNLQ